MPAIPDLPDSVDSLLRVGLVVVTALIGFLVLRQVVRVSVRSLLERRAAESEDESMPPLELERRVSTIARLVVRIGGAVVAVIAVLMILGEFDIDIGPAVAGLGVVGIAVGFGAQTLIRDWLAGIFIVLENQYSEGDVVRIAGVDGVVEAFSLRRTTLRDLDGTVHTVPNGQITVASNMTRLWSRVNLDVGVAFDSDIDRATALIDRVGEELQADEEWGPRLLEAPAVVRVDAVAGSVVTLKVLGQVRAAEQWAVAGELRKRILAAFAREGIDMPLPHQVIVTRGPAAAGTSAEDASAEAPAPDADPTKPVGPAR
ncbi:MAG TPA: mechanosensitive ion channel family protein [Candidatus Limnocylindria bacterium]